MSGEVPEVLFLKREPARVAVVTLLHVLCEAAQHGQLLLGRNQRVDVVLLPAIVPVVVDRNKVVTRVGEQHAQTYGMLTDTFDTIWEDQQAIAVLEVPMHGDQLALNGTVVSPEKGTITAPVSNGVTHEVSHERSKVD